MTTYREVKDRQLKVLVELKEVNRVLKELRPKLEAERSFNKLHKTKFDTVKIDFYVRKSEQASILKELKVLNAQLAELRAVKAPRTVKDAGAAKAAREAAKAERQAERAAKKAQRETAFAQSKVERQAEREARRIKREADREARREELEEQGRSATGYNIPLLTDQEREATTLMNKVFAELSKQNVELHEKNRQAHIAKLLEN